jgi:hypothetical protein
MVVFSGAAVYPMRSIVQQFVCTARETLTSPARVGFLFYKLLIYKNLLRHHGSDKAEIKG